MQFKQIIPGTWVHVNGQLVLKINPDSFLAQDKNLYSVAVTSSGDLLYVPPSQGVTSIQKNSKSA